MSKKSSSLLPTQLNPNSDMWNMYWICSYWVRHPVSWFWDWWDNCDCYTKLKIYPSEVHDRMRGLWYKIEHPRDVTNEMLRVYKSTYFKNWNYI